MAKRSLHEEKALLLFKYQSVVVSIVVYSESF